MPDVELDFSRAEYAERLAATRRAMEAAGIEVLLSVDPSNMAWLTGYDGWSFYVHQGVLVSLHEDPIWWGRAMDGFGARRTVWMAEDRIAPYGDDYVMSTERHPMQHLAGLIRDRGWARARIGVEMENYYYSAKAHAVLAHELAEARLVDATALVNWRRTVKSPQEIVYMRRAARIVEAMLARAAEATAPGVRKCDVVAEICRQGIAGADGHGGDYPAIVPLTPTGLDAAAPHLTWDDKPFETGAGTFFELAGCHRRYHCPLCRTIYLGRPPQDMLDAERAVLEGLEAGIDAARSGARAADVANAFYGVLARHGIAREGRCGYPIGLSYPPDWGERTISIRPSDQSVLQPGMTFHFMPGIWAEGWGLEITESILIRDQGPAECLADYPRGLLVKR